jgi:hypothetical protein
MRAGGWNTSTLKSNCANASLAAPPLLPGTIRVCEEMAQSQDPRVVLRLRCVPSKQPLNPRMGQNGLTNSGHLLDFRPSQGCRLIRDSISLQRGFVSLRPASELPRWRNWQTRNVEVVVAFGPCWFNSSPGHTDPDLLSKDGRSGFFRRLRRVRYISSPAKPQAAANFVASNFASHLHLGDT